MKARKKAPARAILVMMRSIYRPLTRSDARMTAVFLHIFRKRDVQRNSRVEICEEHNQDTYGVGHRAPCKNLRSMHRVILYELCDGNRNISKTKQDDGNTPAWLTFRNVSGPPYIFGRRYVYTVPHFGADLRSMTTTIMNKAITAKSKAWKMSSNSLDILVNRHAPEGRYDTAR